MKQSEIPLYLDYAATTPVDPRVIAAMEPYFNKAYGNPASLHWAGRAAARAVTESRQTLAAAIQAEPEEIIFTSSATEANNLALKGLAAVESSDERHRILISAVEHDCVINSAHWLAQQGLEVAVIPVDEYGRVVLDKLAAMIDERVLLVSVMHANNEIGTIQPIQQVAALCHQVGAKLHVDAAQTLGKLPIDLSKLNIDLLSTSSHKIYGPKGIGFLWIKPGIELKPLLHGGGQERGLRSSTLNVPAIVGFAEAIRISLESRTEEALSIGRLRDKLISAVLEKVPNSYLNGHPTQRLYNNANFRFDFVEGEAIVLGLDEHGIAASTGSACSSPKLEPSHVLLAIGLEPVQAHGSLRVTLGRWTTEAEIDQVIEAISKVISNLRKLSPFKS